MRHLPNLLSLLNLGLGIAGIILALSGELGVAALVLLIGMMLDLWDGKLARLLNAESAVGKDLDSLADMVASGAAPAALLYSFLANTEPFPSWFAFAQMGSVNAAALVLAAIFAMATGIRLAVYNNLEPGKHFRGIPSTMAGGALVIVVGYHDLPVGLLALFTDPSWLPSALPVWLVASVALLLPLLMNLPWAYSRSSMGFLGKARSVWGWIGNGLLILAVILAFRTVLLILFLGYILLGPLRALISRRQSPSTAGTT